MGTLRVAALLAVAVAGPPLYALVSAGTMDELTALTRGTVVLGGCALGAAFVNEIIGGYRTQIDHAAELEAREARLLAAAEAVAAAEKAAAEELRATAEKVEAQLAHDRKMAKINASLEGIPDAPSPDLPGPFSARGTQ